MRRLLFGLALSLITAVALAQSPPLANWPAPGGFSASDHRLRPESAAPFIGITPCRQYCDSRNTDGPWRTTPCGPWL